MRATVLQGERAVELVDVPDPELPGADGVVVQIERTAICGSDLHLYHAEMGSQPGIRLGHEFIGTIAEAGPDVRNAKVGDRVLVSGVIGCGVCPPCIARDPVLCDRGPATAFGTTPLLHGGQAEAVAVPTADANVMSIPSDITVEQAVLLTDILPTGYLGCLAADITPGDVVVLIGLGPVGLMALRCLLLFGASRIIAVDGIPERRARAEALGVETIDPSDGGTVPQVYAKTGGRGAAAVIEAVGAEGSITDAIWCARQGATVSIIGVNLNMAFPFPMPLALVRRLTIKVQLASVQSTWDALVPLVAAGKIQPDDVFTHHMPLSDVAEAYRLFDAKEAGILKVLLDPTR
jgi:2-desacetyl-2-hydroxyethyl bacteriochlorophyllide A dehydrogenase